MRVIAALERTAEYAGLMAAFGTVADNVSWQSVGGALGTTADEARGRVWKYQLRG